MIPTITSYLSSLLSTNFAAGAAGGLVHFLATKNKIIIEALLEILGGAIIAHYTTPAVIKHINVADGEIAGGIGFVLGIIGIYLVKALVRIAQKYSQNPVIPSSLSVTGIVDAYQESINNNNNKNNNDGTNGQTEKSEKP